MSLNQAATVHGVFIGTVSPVKDSCKRPGVRYFDGQLSDGKKSARMISFEPKLKTDVEKARERGEEVAITNCTVQESKRPGYEGLAIVANSRTTVVKSPKQFHVEKTTTECESVVNTKEIRTIAEIKDLAINQRVTIAGKVIAVQPRGVRQSRGVTLTKQEFTLADCTAVV